METFDITNWDEPHDDARKQQALLSLEAGEVLYLPKLAFNLYPLEKNYLTANIANPKSKNISYDASIGNLQGAICSKQDSIQMTQMIERYAAYSKMLIENLLPYYQPHLLQGRTSFRPVEIKDRKASSYRKDDTRLHVDAFPATPTQGKRILRVFTNVNPLEPRIWRIGAPFHKVLEYFHPKLAPPLPGLAALLHTLKITKQKRKKYDHYLLQLHNAMKKDMDYQQKVPQIEFHFPPQSTWLAFTDQVSHAAMKGKFAFEQTFYLPHQALFEKKKSPCSILEKYIGDKML